MDDAAAIREGAREVLRDIEPSTLGDELQALIDDAWMVPGVLTALVARRAGADGLSPAIRSRAVAVQLVYEGLALTRRLVYEEPWAGDPPADGADLDVLVADVLVARGAYLLARTEAADKGVEIIRKFGRDQTRCPRGDAGTELEADIFELAAVAGSTAVAPEPAGGLLEWSAGLAAHLDGDRPDLATLLARAGATGGAGQPAVANESRGSSDP